VSFRDKSSEGGGGSKGGQFGELQSNCTKDRAEHVPSASTQIHTNTKEYSDIKGV